MTGADSPLGLYDHAARAGNRGDLWKHRVLHEIATGICAAPDFAAGDRLLRYAESHAGPGDYPLADGDPRRAAIQRVVAALPCVPLEAVLAGRQYPGSWRWLAQLWERLGIRYEQQLWDLRFGVRKPTAEQRFFRADGYHGVANANTSFDLLLIDPPYSPDPDADIRSVTTLIERRRERDHAILVWYPLLAGRDDSACFRRAGMDCHQIEWVGGREPGKMIGAGLAGLRIHWPEPGWLTQLARALNARYPSRC